MFVARAVLVIAAFAVALGLSAGSASGQMRPPDPFRPFGADTMDDFQGVCFGTPGSAGPLEVYWAGVCRFQRFEDGDWRVITSASPLGPIQRQWGPQEIDAILEYEDVKVFPLSLFAILDDWGVIFLAPRDIDVQLDIAREVSDKTPPDTEFGVLKVTQRAIMTVSNFEGQNFSGSRPVNLVEIYVDVLEEDKAAAKESLARKALQGRRPLSEDSTGVPEVFRYLNLGDAAQ